jgi:hypothetical protein
MKDKHLEEILATYVNDIKKDLNSIYNCEIEHIIESGKMMEINKEIENWEDIIKNSYEIKISYSYIIPPPLSPKAQLLIFGLKILLAIEKIRNPGEKIEEDTNQLDRLFNRQKEDIKNFEIIEKYKNPLEPSENVEYDITYTSSCYDNRIDKIISTMEEIIRKSGFKLKERDYKLKVEINYKGGKISENPKISIERGENYLLYREEDISINYELSIKLTKERYNENDYLI